MPTPRPTRLVAAILAAALIGTAWSSGLETIELDGYRATFDPDQDFLVLEGELDCTAFGGPAAVPVTETSGRLGEADYLVYQPAEWNGDLVLFAHGALPPFLPPGVFWFPLPLGVGPESEDPQFSLFRDPMLCNGFAWAASASERYGVSVEEGMRDTHLLHAIAPHHLGAAPAATYVTGHSMGGLVAVALAERFPHRYVGALSTSAPLAGMVDAGAHFFHVRVLFDVFFPGLLEGPLDTEVAMTLPEFEAFVAELVARVQNDPSVLQRMASVRFSGSERVDPEGIGAPLLAADPAAADPAAEISSLLNSLLAPLSGYLFTLDDFRARSGGSARILDNRLIEYTGFGWTAEEEADLNARVLRIEADPWAVRYWTFNYTPSGELRIPLVNLVGSHDPLEPIVSEWTYAQNVARAGSSAWYSAWVTPRYGHFPTPQEYETAHLALVDWVETGVRPTWPTSP